MTTTIPTRPLGRTGLEIPILGFGTGEAGMGLKNRRAIDLYRFAIDRGVTYFDTAPVYENAQKQLAKVLRKSFDRSSIILASKAATANGRELTKIFESNLRTLKTDHLDIAYIHALGSYDSDEVLDSGGALEALVDMKQRGLARFSAIYRIYLSQSSGHLCQSSQIDGKYRRRHVGDESNRDTHVRI